MAEKLFNILFVLYPVANIYGIGIQGFSIGKVLMLVSGFYLLCRNGFSLSFPKKYLCFATWMFIVPFFYLFSSWVVPNSIVYKSIGLIVFVLLVGLSCRFIKIEYAIAYFRKSALLFTAFFYLQFFVNVFTGIKILGIIPGLPLADASSIDSYLSMQSRLTRYCSVFLEPSHFAVYISMFLALKLVLLKGKIVNKDVLFVFIALFLLQSGNGYTCLLAIGVAYFIVNVKSLFHSPKKLIIILFSISIVGMGYMYASKSDSFSETFDRMDEVEANGDQNSSGFTRIFRGFYYYSDLNEFEKIMGIGQGNEFDYARTHKLHSFRLLDTYTDTVYLNGIQQLLVYGGIVGGILFISFLLQYYKSRNTIYLVLPFTFLFFISGVYNGSMMLLYIVFMEAIIRKERYFINKNNIKSLNHV